MGQLGKNELATAALAMVWFNLWDSTMTGFMTAIDTLLSQSYGANQLDDFSAWTANSLTIIFPATAVVSGAIALCGPCMKLFGQDPELADEAAKFSCQRIAVAERACADEFQPLVELNLDEPTTAPERVGGDGRDGRIDAGASYVRGGGASIPPPRVHERYRSTAASVIRPTEQSQFPRNRRHLPWIASATTAPNL